MTFGFPLFLAAALAAVVPVILHLINRRRAKQLPFATLRFLRISVQRTRRRKRIHDLLLMLLRMAVLILLAVGLAKPTLTSLKSLFGAGSETAMAVILDNSASMGLLDQGGERFETARSAALQILNEAKDGDQTTLFLSGGPAFPEQGRLDRTGEKVRQILQACGPSYEKADLGILVRQAKTLLAESRAVNKYVFVITDMQALSWEGLEATKEPDAVAENEYTDPEDEIPVIVVDCNRAPKPNVAVTGVELKAPVPITGIPVKAAVELFNSSTVEQKRHLELFVNGGKKADSEVITIPPEERAAHEFDFAFDRGGLQRCEVRLVGTDGSKLDDRRFFSATIDQGIPVAIVKARNHEIPYLEDTFYLQRALTPVRSENWALRVTMLTAEELISEPLGPYTVVYCVNLPAPDADTAARLRQYVEQGGNLAWIAGENVDPIAYSTMDEEAGRSLLPAPILDTRTADAAEDRDSWHVASLSADHPAMRLFLEPASLYTSVLVYKFVAIDENVAADGESGGARVLMRLDDGSPLLLSRNVQRGRVLFLATSVHVGWTNLPLRPLFLPLWAQLTFELAGVEQAKHRVIAGAPLALPFAEQTEPLSVEVLTPGGATIRRETEALEGGGQVFRFPETHEIGIYRLRPLKGTGKDEVAFSVNIDPDEARLETIDPETLKGRLGPDPVLFAENPDDLASTFAELREGKSLWSLFLGCVLACLVFETLISNQMSPKEEEDVPRDVPPGMRRLARKKE